MTEFDAEDCRTLLSSFVNDSVASMNFLFLSWWRSSIWSSSASSFLCDARQTGTAVVIVVVVMKLEGSDVIVRSYLVYHQRLDLALEDLHASGGDDRPHVWDHALAEDLTDEAMVALETSRGRVLYGKAVVVI